MSEFNNMVVKLPISILAKIANSTVERDLEVPSDTWDAGQVCEPSDAMERLGMPWALVVKYDGSSGQYGTRGFETQSECAEAVTEYYHKQVEVLHVLKNGIPRKTVKIEVKARFR